MSRSYSNFLLFEDVLTNLPPGSSIINAAANTLMNPSLTITEEDCGTLLGTTLTTIDYTIVNQIELASLAPITTNRVDQMVAQGVTSVKVRDISTCIAQNGVCAICYESKYGVNPVTLDGTWALNGIVPLSGYNLRPVGEVVQIASEFVYASDIIIGNGVDSVYPLSQTSANYSRTSYNPILDPEVLSITDTEITFTSVRSTTDIFVLHYFTTTSDPFLEYIGKSYSGGILGVAPLPTFPLPIRASLYQNMFSDSQIAVMKQDLVTLARNTPTEFLDYCDTIKDPLEKILFIIYLYGVFGNITG